MPSFQYKAVNTLGHNETGQLDADSNQAARQALRNRGLLPLEVTQLKRKRIGSLWYKSINTSELGWLTRQLASLLAAGLPLESALKAIMQQSENNHSRQVLAAVRDDVRAGMPLGQSLATYPKDFPDVYLALVDAGEQSGDLEQVLERLADYIETRGELRNKIIAAFIYPAIVTVISIAIVVFLLSYVVPQVVGAFAHSQQTLPILTRIMLALSDWVSEWGAVSFIVLILLWCVWRLALRNKAVLLAWHTRKLRLPVFGGYIKGVDLARFASTLSILSVSGVPLLTGLQAAGRTIKNLQLRQAVASASVLVKQGSSLANALKEQNVFPPLLIYLVDSGERTGNLAAMLERAAKVLSTELERRAVLLTAFLEPILILFMGLVVLLIVLAVMMPIIELNQLIQ